MFDFATTDLSLAIAHHLLIFLLAGVLAFAIGVIRPSMKRKDILRIASVDNWYGILALAILVVGFSLAIYAAKGLGLLPGQWILLGQDRGFHRGRPALGHADDTDHSLAPVTNGSADTRMISQLPPRVSGHSPVKSLDLHRADRRSIMQRAEEILTGACQHDPSPVHIQRRTRPM
jgi:Predicted membrane protein (DUF2214)